MSLKVEMMEGLWSRSGEETVDEEGGNAGGGSNKVRALR
jgi:hypothetical protein